MAIILNKQSSLNKQMQLYFGIGLVLVIVSFIIGSSNMVLSAVAMALALMSFGRGAIFLLGGIGEWKVMTIIKRFGDNYYLINDTIVNGAQIDHILVCPKGLYTIETKHYDGKVYGSDRKDQWTQYFKTKNNKFYSPIKQGKKHSLVLANALKEKGVDIFIKTIVVFTGRARVKVQTNTVPVLYSKDLYNHISKQKDVLSDDVITKYKNLLVDITKIS
jgi:hypothetical protein